MYDSINVAMSDVCSRVFRASGFWLFNYNVNAIINNINNHYANKQRRRTILNSLLLSFFVDVQLWMVYFGIISSSPKSVLIVAKAGKLTMFSIIGGIIFLSLLIATVQ